MTFKPITLSSLEERSGLKLRDGELVPYVSYGAEGSIQQVAQRSEGVFHKAQVKYGIEHFASHGYKVFPRHIAVDGVNRWADFAVARYRRVILVECMTNWYPSTIERKMELASACELWFIAEPIGMQLLRGRGYKCSVLPCADSEEWRGLNTTFWICRPNGARSL